jgi:hypothetical protein
MHPSILDPHNGSKFNFCLKDDLLITYSKHDALLKSWDLTTKENIKSIEIKDCEIKSFLIVDDILYTGTSADEVLMWDLNTYQCSNILKCPNPVTYLNQMGSFLVCGGEGFLCIWDLVQKEWLMPLEKIGSEPLVEFIKGCIQIDSAIFFILDNSLYKFNLYSNSSLFLSHILDDFVIPNKLNEMNGSWEKFKMNAFKLCYGTDQGCGEFWNSSSEEDVKKQTGVIYIYVLHEILSLLKERTVAKQNQALMLLGKLPEFIQTQVLHKIGMPLNEIAMKDRAALFQSILDDLILSIKKE